MPNMHDGRRWLDYARAYGRIRFLIPTFVFSHTQVSYIL